jgi:ribosomal-protein-alanine N-acetyltransferase
MHLRPITSDDIKALVVLDRLCFARGVAYSADEFSFFLSLQNSLGILCEENERVAAFILAVWSGQVAELITIDVHPSRRRKGAGTSMLHRIEEELKAHRVSTECLHVSVENYPALSFYRKEGFKIVDTIRNYYRDGGHAYFMAKILLRQITDPKAEAK